MLAVSVKAVVPLFRIPSIPLFENFVSELFRIDFEEYGGNTDQDLCQSHFSSSGNILGSRPPPPSGFSPAIG